MDEGICSVENVQTACQLIKQVRSICSQGGVRLNKFLSNTVDVVKSVPASEWDASIQNLNLNSDVLPVDSTLGISLSVQTDEFQFSVNSIGGKHTQRTLLSIVTSVYDSLG